MPFWYVYPIWHRVSFTLVARKHLEHLKRSIRIEEVDELAFPHISPHSRPIVVLHPFFFMMMRASRQISRRLHRYGALIGIDVADSDRISGLAVSMTNYAHAMIVPSTFSQRAFVASGVQVQVHVVPHGLDAEWYVAERGRTRYFDDLRRLRERRRVKLILFFLWHSDYRKGADLVLSWYRELRRERRDVLLVVKTVGEYSELVARAKDYGVVHVRGWLTEEQKMELYDLADLYPLFSRGGGFEMNGLEALARLVPVIAAQGGSWEDYMPPWLLVESRRTRWVLKDNPIHVGGGVEVDVSKAVDKAHWVLDNLDDVRARLAEHRAQRLYMEFRWDRAAERILSILLETKQKLGL